ncbi:hypothetical protein [Wolbachia endosymbiont (group A) of Myopa testacea]|uniref:hypothetical protein n=1 Tax=Wolbachia endosymbiont (group A) of Myopa testacea TaxID=3066148 RepID=UPI003132BBD1
MEKRSARTIKIFTGETMRKKVLTVTCRYEPDELAEQHLADAYKLLLRYAVKRTNEKEVKENDNSSIICESFIEETSAEQYNREPNCRAQV